MLDSKPKKAYDKTIKRKAQNKNTRSQIRKEEKMNYWEAYEDFMNRSDDQLIGVWENGIEMTNTEYEAYKNVLKERGIDLEKCMSEIWD